MSGIEWGVRYRLRRSAVTLRAGDWSYGPGGSKTEAEADLSSFRAQASEKTWEASLVWRTPAVPAGQWQDWEPAEPGRTPGSESALEPQVLSDLLLIADGTAIPAEVIGAWTADERQAAGEWAAAEHLSASDNPVRRLPKPGFVVRAEEICASPAQAQLAVEAWADRTGDGAWMMNPSAVARMGREAVTGLIMLLGERQPAS